MILKPGFELVEIADEYMAIPVGEKSNTFGGLVALSDAAYFLLKNLDRQQTKESLIDLLMGEYDVDYSVAKKDLETLIPKLIELGLIEE